MNKIIIIFLLLLSVSLTAQIKNPAEIESLGKLLYRLEKASWYSTDHFLANYPALRDSIGGYLSYEGTDSRISTIYFKRSNPQQIVGTYKFDSLPNPNSLVVDTTLRESVGIEKDLIAIRTDALIRLNQNEDEFFSFYENTSLNIIPISYKKTKSVYVITAPQISGVLLLGNDYLLSYDKSNELESKIKLHNTIIQFQTKAQDSVKQILETYHSHVNTDYITPTDICTLLLYKDYVEWKKHYTISEKQVSIFNLEKESLFTMTTEAWEKISKSSKN